MDPRIERDGAENNGRRQELVETDALGKFGGAPSQHRTVEANASWRAACWATSL